MIVAIIHGNTKSLSAVNNTAPSSHVFNVCKCTGIKVHSKIADQRYTASILHAHMLIYATF